MPEPNFIRRVAAIHDLCSFGKASLTVVNPTLSAMGIQVCPIPTALLSTHTGGFDSFSFLDLTSEMEKIIFQLQSLDLKFDAIYSGFLGSPEQVEIVSQFIDSFRSDNQLVLVDPVMADNGALYQTMGPTMVTEMKKLVRKADIVTPNLTELCFLVDKPYSEYIPLHVIMQWMKQLADEGPKFVVVTSVPMLGTTHFAVVGLDRRTGRFWKVKSDKLPVQYPGTGDTFASVFLGNILKGESFPSSLDRAVQFVSLAIRWSFGFDHERREGVTVEGVLHTLHDTVHSYTYEFIDEVITDFQTE